MKLYRTELPELKPENAIKILETCRDIHLEYENRRKRNTQMSKWDKYWINAYNVVIKVLKEKDKTK